jgi:hypothetical protein
MSTKSNSSSGGIGFSGLLTIVFVTLKLVGKIDWSWWWVLSPIWGSAALFLCVFVIAVTCMVIARRHETPLERSLRQLGERVR